MKKIVDQAKFMLNEKKDIQRAIKNKKYLKSPYSFIGISKKDVNAIGAEIRRNYITMDKANMITNLDELWQSSIHEEKTLAIVLAGLFINQFKVDDISNIFSRWLDGCKTWDHVDELCITVIGRLLIKDESYWATVFEWASSESMWKQRASLVTHIPTIRQGYPRINFLESTCVKLGCKEQFYIKKAIGWVLRELGDYNKEILIALLGRIEKHLSPLSCRESMRKL